ncbi:hypothetical protein BDP55DRAFT_566587 [Colletotrichum godetiae]|uniref:Uncharacterized protein n=1 Tax=Colletotrichum godetiae TaxID=1209918 RepID=A0AAJ0A760_9PEZI|nr:uncharacterized protein BDP55DRAFT_566587 [Colletotrichum godetiae]KAK1657748.1 hypothetical protein BDP55DRAFT_566587 [Colletotrichum godetiae]
MALNTSLSAVDVRRAFTEAAFLYANDASVGQRVKEFQQRGFPIESADGLDFCKQNVFEDQRVRLVLEALFPWCAVGIYEVYRSSPECIYGYMTGLNSELKAAVVRLQSPGSSVVVLDGSHRLPIRGFVASNGLLEIPYAPLRNCKEIEIDMAEGGLIIHDARLQIRSMKGYSVQLCFATEDEIQGWPRKKFPDSQALKQQAIAMETPTMGVNFVFGDQ